MVGKSKQLKIWMYTFRVTSLILVNMPSYTMCLFSFIFVIYVKVTCFLGRSAENGSTNTSMDSWDEVKKKLMGALNAIQYNVVAKGLNDQAISYKTDRKNHPLSLHAIAEGPRLRLFLSTVLHLQKEAGIVFDTYF